MRLVRSSTFNLKELMSEYESTQDNLRIIFLPRYLHSILELLNHSLFKIPILVKRNFQADHYPSLSFVGYLVARRTLHNI